jgi:hypothetical protein
VAAGEQVQRAAPRFVNKMDRVGAELLQVVDQMKRASRPIRCRSRCPIGAEDAFEGVVDLVRMKAIYWDDASAGHALRDARHPRRARRAAQEWREKMIESAAEANEEVMNKYLETASALGRGDQAGPAGARDRRRDRADALRLGVQEQGRAGDARRGRSTTCLRRPTSRRQGRARERQRRRAPAVDEAPFAASRSRS